MTKQEAVNKFKQGGNFKKAELVEMFEAIAGIPVPSKLRTAKMIQERISDRIASAERVAAMVKSRL